MPEIGSDKMSALVTLTLIAVCLISLLWVTRKKKDD